MILTIDIGNSNIVLGGYEGDAIRFLSRIATNRRHEADQYAIELAGVLTLHGVANSAISGVAISSVVPGVTPAMVQALAHFSAADPFLLSPADAGDIRVDIENPAELGMDILASAIATRLAHPLPAVIIDMGTATKLTGLDENGVLRGVAIAPGLYVSLDALVSGTSLLRGIPLEAPAAAMGRNTTESMKSGMVLGTAAMLDGMIDHFAREMGGLATVVATGGALPAIVPHCRHSIHCSDTLLLDGLYHAYRRRRTN